MSGRVTQLMPYRRIYFSSKAKSKAKVASQAARVFFSSSIVGSSLSRLGFHLSSELGFFLVLDVGFVFGVFFWVWDGFH